jgi:hypothetical protein
VPGAVDSACSVLGDGGLKRYLALAASNPLRAVSLLGVLVCLFLMSAIFHL